MEKFGQQYGVRKPEYVLYKLKYDKSDMNDFGVEIHRENYARFIKQYNPDETSDPAYRVTNPVSRFSTNDSPFARFCRRITAGEKDAIYLNFSKNIFSNGHDDSYPATFEVRYHDKGNVKSLDHGPI